MNKPNAAGAFMFHPEWERYPYPSTRHVVYAGNGMVATSQPLAAAAGLSILQKGGNAIDAAIATAACLTVVEPTSNGIGGDAFALVWAGGKLYGLNASGIAPALMTIAAIHDRGHAQIPASGFLPVLVPGIPAAWRDLSRKFGRLSLAECLEPAITHAREGYPVSCHVAMHWQRAFRIYRERHVGAAFASWFDTFAPAGCAPKAGERWSSPTHAATLTKIGATRADAFYHGEIAEEIDAFSRRFDGLIRKSDLERYEPLWVDPISVNYKGYDVCEIPPNGQGMIALAALAMLGDDAFAVKEDINTYHLQIEAMKLAFADGLAYIADPKTMPVSPSDLLSPAYVKARRSLIGPEAALPTAGNPAAGGTVYLACADGEGNMVSYIQSNYMGFGSGLVVPGTGIALQNRGHNFSLDPTAANALAPFKRSYHTIIPGFLMKAGKAVGPFGVMGGFMQPQGHLQVVMNTIDFHLNPQAALDAPRWQWIEGKTVTVEPAVPAGIVAGLRARGHVVSVDPELSRFGRGQIIWRDAKSGVLCGGTEPRCDGTIAAW